jgi:prolipoprotein diacylglyceryltransferase
LVLGVVLAADRRLGHEARPRGALTGILLLTLFSGRFFVEFLKQPEGGQILGVFNRAQQLSLPLVILGAWILHDSLKKRLPAGWSVAAPG